jgi:50S ribosomal subunit-associated GTPase HflX
LGEIKKNADQDVSILLVGNKIDKLEGDPDLRCAPVKAVKEWTESHGVFSYREISAYKREDADLIMKVLLEGIKRGMISLFWLRDSWKEQKGCYDWQKICRSWGRHCQSTTQ